MTRPATNIPAATDPYNIDTTDPYAVEVSSAGLVSYSTLYGEIWSEDVSSQVSTELVGFRDGPDLELSADGTSLFAGESSGGRLRRYNVFTDAPRIADESSSSSRVEFNTPALIDVTSGNVLDSKYGTFEGALSASADGKTLLVAESGGSGSVVTRYDVSAGKLQKIAATSYALSDSFGYPDRHAVATPDATRLYYAGDCLDAVTLDKVLYTQADTILSVTPDSRLAISATKVYRVSDGTLLGSLPTSSSIQAVSPDSKKLYVWSSGALATVDLTVF